VGLFNVRVILREEVELILLGSALAGRDGLIRHRSLRLLGWKFYDSFNCQRILWEVAKSRQQRGSGVEAISGSSLLRPCTAHIAQGALRAYSGRLSAQVRAAPAQHGSYSRSGRGKTFRWSSIPLTATRSAPPRIYNARRGTPPMTKHTNIYLDSASRRKRCLLSTRTPSGQAATKFGLAVDQRGWPTLWRLKGYRCILTIW